MLKWFRRRLAEWRAQQQAWAGMTDEAVQPGLCRFQIQCEAAVVAALEKTGIQLVDRVIEGSVKGNPGFIKARMAGTPWTLWILPVGAGIAVPKGATLVRMDAFDYDSPQDFIDTFVEQMMSGLEKDNQEPERS